MALAIQDTDVILAVQTAIRSLSNYPDAKRRQMLSVGLGKTLSTSLDLPGRIEGSIRIFYENHHAASVAKVVSQVNEVYLLDTTLAIETAYLWFEFRYNLTFNPEAFASFVDRLALWSEGILPERIKELAQEITSKESINDDFRSLVKSLHNGIVVLSDNQASTPQAILAAPIGG